MHAYPGPNFHPADSLEHHSEQDACREGAWKMRLSVAGEVRTGSILLVLCGRVDLLSPKPW